VSVRAADTGLARAHLDAFAETATRFETEAQGATLASFLAFLNAAESEERGLAAGEVELVEGAVQLLTVHAAKGLEWDVVAVAGVQEGIWPDLRVRGSLLGSESLVDLVAGRDASALTTVSHLLAEERRLFYVAVTRARRRLVVTAVSSEEAYPSRFLDELLPWTGRGDERPVTRVPRGLDLAAVVAELRSVVCAPADGDDRGRRKAAAYHLARLAAAGIRGADPTQWYAFAPLSDDRPLRAPDETVRVSPSKVEAFSRCALRWLLESCGGTAGDALSQGVGTLVHTLAYEVAVGKVDVDDLPEVFEQRWALLDTGTGWYSTKEHDRAATIVERLAGWLRANPRELVAAEEDFEVGVGRAKLSGRVDRLERDPDGRLVVVDLKAGRSKPAAADLAEHPQLGAYQLAVAKKGFDAVEGEPGGAMLVQLGAGTKVSEQRQPSLADAEDPDWAERLVTETAEGMAGAEFPGTENRWCGVCVSRRSCPVHAEGGQVTP
jgi:RecB family exonuclease